MVCCGCGVGFRGDSFRVGLQGSGEQAGMVISEAGPTTVIVEKQQLAWMLSYLEVCSRTGLR